ncbi:MAG: hypothetical protein M1838_005791, partial [Thelocarpon superellum]
MSNPPSELASSSYIMDEGSPLRTPSPQPFSDDYDSLPSSPSSSSAESTAVDESDAERQWNESLQQLELLLTMVLVPYLGRYFGR